MQREQLDALVAAIGDLTDGVQPSDALIMPGMTRSELLEPSTGLGIEPGAGDGLQILAHAW